MLETLEPRCLLASLAGEVFMDADGNGRRGPEEEPAGFVRVYLDANDNMDLDPAEEFVLTNASGEYSFMNVPVGDQIVRVDPAEGQAQTSPTAFYGVGDIGLFQMSTAGEVRPIGVPGAQIDDVVKTNDGSIIGINVESNSIYSIDPATGAETLLATALVDLVAGLAYDPSSDTVYGLTSVGDEVELREINPVSGQLEDFEPTATKVRVMNFGSTFFDFDTGTGTAVPVPRQSLSPFASTLDARSDGVIFGLQGDDLKQFSFPAEGSTGETVAELSQSIEAISFDADGNLFGVSTIPSTLHPINPATGQVGPGVVITHEGESISSVTGFDIAPDGTHYLVDSTHLYSFDPVTGIATQAANRALPPFSPIFSSLSVSADGDLFATLFNLDTPVAQIDPATGLATRLGDGPLGAPYSAIVAGGAARKLSGLTGASDLAFDTVRNRVVGFDDDNDQFFEFSPDGPARLLATAEVPINSHSLAFDGTNFVMFDDDDVGKTQTLVVNPDTGAVDNGFIASQAVTTGALTHVKRGDVAYRVTVENDTDMIRELDFGLLELESPLRDHPTVINELLVDPLFGNTNTDQLIEIRGEPGGQLRSNTYFVSVDESDNSQGMITGVLDLSDQPLGDNGFLVLLQRGSRHQADSDSMVIQPEGDGSGFDGLLGATFESLAAGGSGYFLIESDVPPVVGDDIDADDSGLIDPDGIVSNWTVLDSLSLHPFVGSQSFGQAYGQILMAESSSFDPNARTVAEGVPIVIGNGNGYAARVGDSVGSDADDWMFGVVESDADAPTGFRVSEFVSHLPNPFVYLDRDLDHVGDSNFVGGVRGTANRLPALDEVGVPQPLVGATVLADTNGNGVRDLLSFTVDPNDLVDEMGVPIEQEQTHAFPGVTLSTADRIFDDQPINFAVTSVAGGGGSLIFAHADIGFFNDIRKLRADFYEPVREVSVRVLGPNVGTSYGRLEAYNAAGDLLDTQLSDPVSGLFGTTVTVSSPGDDIAYTLAYSDTANAPEGASPFGRINRLTYRQLEPAAVTDGNGQFEIKHLFPGEYEVVVLGGGGLLQTPVPVEVIRYENFVVNPTLQGNAAPQVDSEIVFEIEENAAAGTVIGSIIPAELDGQRVRFELVAGQESGLLIHPTSGTLTVGPEAVLDFESGGRRELTVEISDPFESVLTTVIVELIDINEPPIVELVDLIINEESQLGTPLGRVQARDADVNQTLTYSIELDPTLEIPFAINEDSGVITLTGEVDFETINEFILPIRVTDDHPVNPLSTLVNQRILVIDRNDRPVITSTMFMIPENTTGFVGQLDVFDPDVNQTHVFELLGGTGAAHFAVTRSGAIVVRENAEIDFETAPADGYTLNVLTFDNGIPPLAADATVTIKISDVNELPSLVPGGVELPENSIGGTPVATLAVNDPEGSGADYQLELLADGDAEKFEFEPATKTLTVKAGAELDFETDRIQTLHFEITDPSGVSMDPPTLATFIVELSDQNDPPIVLTTEVVISELAVPGTVVGRVEVQVREPDIGDDVTIQLVSSGESGDVSDAFEFIPGTRTLRIAPGAMFDADIEQDPLFIDVRVTDSALSSSVGRIAVILNNINEPPVIVQTPPTPDPIVSGEAFQLVFDEVVDPEGGEFSLAVFDPATGRLPRWMRFDPVTRTLTGLPTPNDLGIRSLKFRAFEVGPTSLFTEIDFDVNVQLGTTPLTNQLNRFDVDGNGIISPLDSLRIINFVNRHGDGTSVLAPVPFAGFVDPSLDGFVTVLDALLVINRLQAGQFGLAEAVGPNDSDPLGNTNDEALIALLGESSLF